MATKSCKIVVSRLRTVTLRSVIGKSMIRTVNDPANTPEKETRLPNYMRMMPFFIDSEKDMSEKEIVSTLNKRRFNYSSHNSFKNYLNKFTGLYLQAVRVDNNPGVRSRDAKVNGEMLDKMEGFPFRGGEYVLFLNGDYPSANKDVSNTEVLSILSKERGSGTEINVSFTEMFYNKMREEMSKGNYKVSIAPAQVLTSLNESNPFSDPMLLNRKTMDRLRKDTSQIKDYSIAQLKELYGMDYEYVFSSPYIITDSMDRTFSKKMIGRPAIFYYKKANGRNKVDDLIKAGNIGDQTLETIPLDEDVMFRNVAELYESFVKIEGGNERLILPTMNNEVRLFMGEWFAAQLHDYFNANSAEFHKYLGFETLSDMVKDKNSSLSITDSHNYISSQMLHFVLKCYQNRSAKKYMAIVKDVDNIIKQNTDEGIYVSPGIVYKYTQDIPLALIDTINPTYKKELFEKLIVSNLAMDPIGLPAANISLNPQVINTIFSKPAELVNVNNNQIAENNVDIRDGLVYPTDINAMYALLNQYGITEEELSTVLHKKLLPLVQERTDINKAISQEMNKHKC